MRKACFISIVLSILVLTTNHVVFAQDAGTNAAAVKAGDKKSQNVGNKICPVSGEKIGQGGMQGATFEYESKVYNLCCPACIEEFEKDPQKYIQKTNEELKVEAKLKTE